MHALESVRQAVAGMVANKLRTVLTLLSIAVGVFAIIGAGTVVDSLNAVVTTQMEQLGSNTFLVQKFPAFFLGARQWRKYMRRRDITYDQVEAVRREATLALSVGCQAGGSYLVRGGGTATDGPVSIVGSDETFYANGNFQVDLGRAVTPADVQYRREVAVIGADVAVRLFENQAPIGQTITIGGHPFVVVGTLARKGSVFGQSQDALVQIPITAFLKYYVNEWETSLTMIVRARGAAVREQAMDQVIGILRGVRRVAPGEENDFEVFTNESLGEAFASFTQYLAYFAIGVSSIALLAAGVGIMNIMLVSVKERTREIGTRKAVGATRAAILTQFLVEAVTLCQLGGLGGIVLGVGAGNIAAGYMGTRAVMPLGSIGLAVGVCTLIGALFGAYPAWRAARLDPIEALRYE